MLERLRPAVIAAFVLGGALPAVAQTGSSQGVPSPAEEPAKLPR